MDYLLGGAEVYMSATSETLLEAVRHGLRQFDFHNVFVEQLGWDNAQQSLRVSGKDVTASLQAIAQKRGFVAYQCTLDDGTIPLAHVRAAIERELTKSNYEHIVIFVDANRTEQVWLWVRRGGDEPLAKREVHYRAGQSGEALAQRLLGIYFSLEEEPDLTLPQIASRARRSFDVDRVTKRFYERFEVEQAAFIEFITGITEKYDKAWYGGLMLNRLMFVYFIQKKAFLAGDPDYLRNRLRSVQQLPGRPRFLTFYRYFLRRLFHEGLGGQARDSALEALLGSVPYLNGGLFELHELEQQYSELDIPDRAFEQVFDFFDSYQWHLDDRPLRTDNEINPDVLGYIFEKYVNQKQMGVDQKQMGAYYSKEDITGHIASSVVLPKLLSNVHAECAVAFDAKSVLLKSLHEQPERYLYPDLTYGLERKLPNEIAAGLTSVDNRATWNQLAPADVALPLETWREVVKRRGVAVDSLAALKDCAWSLAEFVRLNTNLRQIAQDVLNYSEGPELVRAYYKALTQIAVLDPTCGSGAFLFAVLNILEPLYEGCLDRMQAFVDEADRLGEVNRHADFRQILESVGSHPNRRYFIYKSIIVANLYGVDIMEEAIEICKLRLYLKLMSQASSRTDMEPLPDIDFNIRPGNALVGFATLQEAQDAIGSTLDFDGNVKAALGRDAGLAADAFYRFQELQLVVGSTKTAISENKTDLSQRLDALRETLDTALAQRYGVESPPSAFERWRRRHKPFHWCVEFFAIMARGGFDAIIGNPPYVEYRLVTPVYTLPPGQYQSEDAANLYAFCMERSSHLLGTGGWFGMIVPAGLMGVDEAILLRRLLLARFLFAVFSTYAIRPSKLFEGVDQRVCIMFGTAATSPGWHSSCFNHWHGDERPHLFTTLAYAPTEMHRTLARIPQVGSRTAASLLAKLDVQSNRTVAYYYTGGRSGQVIHYHRSPRYWIRGLDFDPYFKSATRSRSVHHIRDIYFRTAREAKIVGALLNSSLFFFWFVTIGNGRNLTGADVEQFPVGDLKDRTLDTLPRLFGQLMHDYERNSFVRVRRDQEYQEFRPSLSKPLIDLIDRAVALHYGFNDEDVDFIVNYAIKYRLGEDDGSEDA